ncbi:kinase-like domain-containing protein [Rhizophagus clarus]|uniref:Kinase-like domain-containing protein n=1 Tax=Rhizophagus clarus TaxID=94130 RepID=A0A8H3R0A0_9GLOM|nr:kinase-like domain-containing protein [Rhizophagus clarus]
MLSENNKYLNSSFIKRKILERFTNLEMSFSSETSISLEHFSKPREIYVEIQNMNKQGAFSSIYSAIWMEGPRWKLDKDAEEWTRTGPIKVILKRLDNSHNMSQEFIDQNKFFIGKRPT